MPERTDTDKMDILRQFMAAEKPPWCGPVDVAVMVAILAQGLDNPELTMWASKATLGLRTGISDERTVSAALLRLDAHGYIHIHSRKGIQRTNLYVVGVAALPLRDFAAKIISREATLLAHWYREKVDALPMQPTRNGKGRYRPKVDKNWHQEWANEMQHHLDDGDTVEQIKGALNQACGDGLNHRRPAPHLLRRHWKTLLTKSEGIKV